MFVGKANQVMTLAAKNYIANDLFGHVRYGRVRRVIVIGLSLVAGCNQIVGFKDVKLDGDAGSSGDAQPKDAAADMAIDTPPQNLYTFVTDASFIGGFGAAAGARTTADIKCQDKYTLSFTALGCTNIHAFIQIDDTMDSLARMKINFPTIPLTSEVKRATDQSPVSSKFDDFVNPNAQLLAPIVPGGGAPILFWSGRSGGGNLTCNKWTVSVNGMSGNAGDVTKTNAWTAQANVMCDNFDQRLVCMCW